jgi:hypothetical protein
MALEFADSNLGRIVFERETEFGALNSPFGGQIARITSSALVADKGTDISAELRSDRMVSDLAETGFSTGGELGGEWSLAFTWSSFIEAALCGVRTQASTVADESVTFTTGSNTIDAIGIGTGRAVDDWIYITGDNVNPANKGWMQIVSVADQDGIVVSRNLTTETTTYDGGGQCVRNGIERYSYNIEQYFTDIDVCQVFLGQRLGMWNLSTQAQAIVTTSWTFMGTSVMAQEALGAYSTDPAARTTMDVVNATSNVARIIIGTNAVACEVQGLEITLDNALRNQSAVGSKYPCGIGYGRQTISGTITLYFQDLDAYNVFINHDAAKIQWEYEDNFGNEMLIVLPYVKFSSGSPALEGIDTDVTMSMDFQALALPRGAGIPSHQIQVCSYTPV